MTVLPLPGTHWHPSYRRKVESQPLPLTPARAPGIDFLLVRIHRVSSTVTVPMDRHSFQHFPTLNGSYTAIEVLSDILPGVQTICDCAFQRLISYHASCDCVAIGRLHAVAFLPFRWASPLPLSSDSSICWPTRFTALAAFPDT